MEIILYYYTDDALIYLAAIGSVIFAPLEQHMQFLKLMVL